MVSAVSRFVSTLIDISLLRAGPQDLPYSQSLFILSAIAYLGVSTLSMRQGLTGSNPLLLSVVSLLSLLFFVWFILSLKGYHSRFNQTATALTGTGIILGILAWGLIAWQVNAMAAGGGSPLASLLYLALIVWNLAINASVIRHALAITIAWAWGVSMAYFFIYMAVIRLITVGLAQGTQ